MHMRTKKWARPELAASPICTDEPERWRGRWAERLGGEGPLHVELGCGKGVSTALMVADTPGVRYLAFDISPDVLGEARRNLVRACGEEPRRVALCRGDISRIRDFIAPEDGVERIYIHFCNPWPKPRHIKRRLTHPRQLMQYRAFLRDGGEIWFKTDSDALFRDSLGYFSLCGFEAVTLIDDLHASGFRPNYVSEHEAMYTAQGIPVKFGIFRKTAQTPDFDPTPWRRPGFRAVPDDRPQANGPQPRADSCQP